jgi:hypothetical protein
MTIRQGPVQGMVHAPAQIATTLPAQVHAVISPASSEKAMLGIRRAPQFDRAQPGRTSYRQGSAQQLFIQFRRALPAQVRGQPGLDLARNWGLGENQQPGVGEFVDHER